MAKNVVNDIDFINDLGFKKVTEVITVNEEQPVKNVEELKVPKTVETAKKVNEVTKVTEVVTVNFCIGMIPDQKAFITTESRRLGMKIKEFVEKMITDADSLPVLTREEATKVHHNASGSKVVCKFTIPSSVADMFEANAQKNMLSKTDYMYYICYNSYKG